MNKGEIRCFCSRSPLLGMWGVDGHGLPYVHVKVFKQKRLYAEMLFTQGIVRLRCRECFRWYTVKIVGARNPSVNQEPVPKEIDLEGVR